MSPLTLLESLKEWHPENHKIISCIDAHTAGEPLRIIVGGWDEPVGETILEKRRWALANQDHWRKALIWEPRGHRDMYGCLIVEPEREDSDFGVLFLHNEGYSTMCGHGIVAVSVVVNQLGGNLSSGQKIKIDTPAGQVTAVIEPGNKDRASFLNVASFVDALDEIASVPELGDITYDLAFGGAYYAFVDLRDNGKQLMETSVAALTRAATRIKETINQSKTINHPIHDDLGFLYGVIFILPPTQGGVHSRHICVFADEEVDRSPTGTGVSARAAILCARDELSVGERISIESITGGQFHVSVAAVTEYGGNTAVIPEVSGTAFITGKSEFIIDEDDPLKHGFLLS